MRDPTYIPPERERLLKRVEYDRLVESGAFENERVELLRGRILAMSPQGARHVEIVKRLTKWLVSALGDRADVLVQSSFAASADSEPEPDIAVVPPADYSASKPTAAWLLIEVSDSTLRIDRMIKSELYAAANVETYWLVDLSQNVVEVRARAAAGVYGSLVTLRAGDVLTVPRFPDVSMPVSELLK